MIASWMKAHLLVTKIYGTGWLGSQDCQWVRMDNIVQGLLCMAKIWRQKLTKVGSPSILFDLPPKNGKIGERPTRCGNSLQPPNSSPSYSTGHQQQKPPSHQPQKPNLFFNKNKLNCDPNNNIAVEAEPIGGHWWTQPLGGHAKHFVCKHSGPWAHHGAGADGLHRGRATSHIVSKWGQKHHKTGAGDKTYLRRTVKLKHHFDITLTDRVSTADVAKAGEVGEEMWRIPVGANYYIAVLYFSVIWVWLGNQLGANWSGSLTYFSPGTWLL